jgi:hypothetical protein
LASRYRTQTPLSFRKQPALDVLREMGLTVRQAAEKTGTSYWTLRNILYGGCRATTGERAALVALTGRRLEELLDEGSLVPKRSSERCRCNRCTLERARRAEAAGVVL